MTIQKLLIQRDKLKREIIRAGNDVERVRRLQEQISEIDEQIEYLGG